jgi:Zn-dependent M28 family amino/carboxypeptidase
MTVTMVPNEKSALVWGVLPGATEETIFVMAHRDGWFDAATDNASGVATMLGLGEFFAKLRPQDRRRTIVFVGLDGHHNDSGGIGRMWMAEHKSELFPKTALAINAEHTSTMQTYFYGEKIRSANTYTAMLWYAGGPSRPKLQALSVRAFREFGVPIYTEPEDAPPPGDLGRFYKFVPGVDAGDFNMYFHTDAETPETVPWTGLEATTRAYAKIIDEVNTLPLSDLQRPEEK